MNCIKCGRDHNDYHFRTLQVQTLHVRDFGKTSRIQALGDFEEYDVCSPCATEKYHGYLNNSAALKKTAILYGTLMALGLVITILFWNGEGVFRLLGLGLLAGGALCLYGGLKNANRKKRELLMLSQEDALYQCAWECLTDAAPSKQDVNDITYIPVDEKTLQRKNGDLMILYDLLPEIAVQAHKRIHGIEDAAEDTEEDIEE